MNAQRIRDIEVPLFDLEQKVMRLEAQLQAKEFDMDLISDAVCKKINQKPMLMLPHITQAVNQVEGLKEKVKLLTQKMSLIETDGNKGKTKPGDDWQGLKFNVNRAIADIDALKKQFESHRID